METLDQHTSFREPRGVKDRARSLNDLMALFDFSGHGRITLPAAQASQLAKALPKQPSTTAARRTPVSAAPKFAVWEAF